MVHDANVGRVGRPQCHGEFDVLEPCLNNLSKLLHFNVGDYIHTPSVNELEQSVALIEETAEKGKTTYVHCKAGRTRSATVCAAYLIKVSENLCFHVSDD